MSKTLTAGIAKDAEYDFGFDDQQPQKRQFQWKLWHFAAIFFVVVLPYILIFVLFGLVSNVKSDGNNNVSAILMKCTCCFS